MIGYVAIEYLGNWDALDGIPKLSALVSTYVQCDGNQDADDIFNFILIFIVTVVVTVNYIILLLLLLFIINNDNNIITVFLSR